MKGRTMKSRGHVLAVNGGSSSIKFALFIYGYFSVESDL
jgi:acetate kinase